MNALISKCFDEVFYLERNATFAAISYKVNRTVSMDGSRNIEWSWNGVSEIYQSQRENWETLGQQQQDYRSFASAVYVCYRE